jgi:SAM-dependent methyltransferase
MGLPSQPEFDDFTDHYDTALERGLSVSGENKEFFARGRVEWTGRLLDALGEQPRRIMDYGCGTGSATPFLLARFPQALLEGVDASGKSLSVARREQGSARASFHLLHEFTPTGHIDLVFCNGVFHHIPLAERAACADYVFRSLRPGGCFALWENNPWNPGTHIVMARIPFDRDAIKVSPPSGRRLLREAGFEIQRTDFRFFFPALLRALRWMEPALRSVPFGAQYVVLARKPTP